jgi:hypothetical protein
MSDAHGLGWMRTDRYACGAPVPEWDGEALAQLPTEKSMLERDWVQRLCFYLGLGLITAATLMLQIIETRIISVTSWYHLAFFVISIAMFGLIRFPAD